MIARGKYGIKYYKVYKGGGFSINQKSVLNNFHEDGNFSIVLI